MTKETKGIRTSIGGQALIEGIMMKSPEKTAVTVRLPDKSLETKMFTEKPLKSRFKILGWPILRGIAGFIDSMKLGFSTLMYSAEKAGIEEEEPGKVDKWLQKTFGDNLVKIVGTLGMVLGLGLAILLFFWLPTFLFNTIQQYVFSVPDIWRGVFEGVLRMAVFVGYIALCARMSEMRRVFMFHGAEHKTIACFESGEELTVENVQKHSRFHPRCGTSFMILMMLIGMIVGMLIPQTGAISRTIMKILCLPLIMGVGYELLKLCGKYDNLLIRIIAAPGLWMQRLTTKEPEDDQIEVAIVAFVAAAPAAELTEEMKAIALCLKAKNEVILPVEETESSAEGEELSEESGSAEQPGEEQPDAEKTGSDEPSAEDSIGGENLSAADAG